MCGILFTAIQGNQDQSTTSRFHGLREQLENSNALRGPDAQTRLECIVDDSYLSLSFFASELFLRGGSMVVQPHHDENNTLCWNGEIFEGLDLQPDENDGAKVFSRLQSCTSTQDVHSLFGGIEGPYAFVYYQKSTRYLYFARDPLGRRSLLIHRPTKENPYFILGSVSVGRHDGYTFEEVSTEGIHCLDLGCLGESSNIVSVFGGSLTLMSWSAAESSMSPFANVLRVNPELPENEPTGIINLYDEIPDFLVEPVERFIAQLDRSVMLQVSDIAKLKKTEGQASVAVLFSGGIDSTILAFLANRHVPMEEPIDLLNVAFENPRKMNANSEENSKKKQQPTLKPARDAYRVPDRVTGLTEVEELRKLCPGRVWNFVEVDVPYKESQTARPLVEAIMFPGNTVMDLSLAIALYFASRGRGTVRSTPDKTPEAFTSSARVLLNGLGSDELLGGYGRHRTAYLAAGWKALLDELQLDLDRIPTRNLGRDDRTISCHGKEARHPFLSMTVVNFISQLPIHYKVDPRLEVGVGDKLLLRLAAAKLGLVEASRRKKRAMQFGTHSARMQSDETNRRGDNTINSA